MNPETKEDKREMGWFVQGKISYDGKLDQGK
jgi:hypothetical protein